MNYIPLNQLGDEADRLSKQHAEAAVFAHTLQKRLVILIAVSISAAALSIFSRVTGYPVLLDQVGAEVGLVFAGLLIVLHMYSGLSEKAASHKIASLRYCEIQGRISNIQSPTSGEPASIMADLAHVKNTSPAPDDLIFLHRIMSLPGAR